jgi:glycosyltransferase involved in cell wall biosynthesis
MDVLRYPLYEEGIVNSLGVVTHSRQQAIDVRKGWLGPVTSLHLPCYRDVLSKASGVRRPVGEGRLRLLTMGHINPNKQVHRVIQMLVSDPELASKVEYRVAGPDGGFIAYRDTLRRLVNSSNGHLDVKILGWLPDDELEREMESADIFVNLRDPNIEGGSASLMKQLAFARPVLCFDTGCFAEMPEGSVERVPVGDFEAAATKLREIVQSEGRRRQLGENARKVATSYSEVRYAAGIFEFMEQCQSATPALRFLDLIAQELGDMQVNARLSIFDEIANDFGRILTL